MEIDKSRLRTNLPQIGEQPYRQVHAHSTGNPNSTAQNEALYLVVASELQLMKDVLEYDSDLKDLFEEVKTKREKGES